MNKNSKIYVAGHRGMVGSALIRTLKAQGYNNLLIQEVDLKDQVAVSIFFATHEPEYVFLTAGVVGGVKYNNSSRATFVYDNIMIAANVIEASREFKVKKLLFTGSSCIYPNNIQRPICESDFMEGPLEKTNEPYAIAKIAGIKMCEAYRDQYGCNFISAMPTNSYGPNDKYDLDKSHVLPALIRKIITAKEQGENIVKVWGTGNPRREFIYVDDMADALIFLMQTYDSPEIINVGTGEEVSIRQLCNLIKYILKWDGDFEFSGDLDGTFRKLLDIKKLTDLGWKYKTEIYSGVEKTIEDIKQRNLIQSWL